MKTEGYWICQFEHHSAVLELISEEEIDKFRNIQGPFWQLCYAKDKTAALDKVQVMLQKAWEKDPDMKDVKKTLRDLYG